MSDVSAVTNLIGTANEGFITTLASPGVTSGGVTVPLASVSGLTNGTVFVGLIEPGKANEQVFTGTVDTAGSQITGVKWTRGNNVAHAAGVTIVDYPTGTLFNMLARHVRTQHNQDGTHGAVTATSVATDTISEKTPNAGVTIDGVLMKDGKIGTTSAVPASVIDFTSIATVTSYANAGSGGGTFYYINLFGIKLLWGTSTTYTVGSNSNATKTVTLPGSFFTTITATLSDLLPSTNGSQWTNISSTSTSSVSVQTVNNSASAITADQFYLLVIGT